MLCFAASEMQWEERLINIQHLVNEVTSYFFCVALVCFTGVLSEAAHRVALGSVVIFATLAFITFNVVVILIDFVRFLRAMVARYRAVMRRSRSTVSVAKKQRVGYRTPFNKIQVETEMGLKEDEDDEFDSKCLEHGDNDLEVKLPSGEKQKDAILIEDNIPVPVPQIATRKVTPLGAV